MSRRPSGGFSIALSDRVMAMRDVIGTALAGLTIRADIPRPGEEGVVHRGVAATMVVTGADGSRYLVTVQPLAVQP